MSTEITNFLNQLGLLRNDVSGLMHLITTAVLLILFIWVIVLSVKGAKMKKRLTQLTMGKSGSSLEQQLTQLFAEHKRLKEDEERNRKDIRAIFKTLTNTYQKMGLVKYDAFNQMGGSLSFSLAMLDEKEDGFILNSVHSSDGCYVYTKEIKAGFCELDLGEEEAKALLMAKGE